MKQGYLSQYFKSIAAKVLSRVEIDITKSNQHEINGTAPLKRIFGPNKRRFSAQFLYLSDNDDEPVKSDGFLTWYDAREQHPTRTEYRMYFPTTFVSNCASEGDMLFIALKPDDSVLVIIAECNSTIANQLSWLFGINKGYPGFSIREELESEQDRIAFVSRIILEEIGIEIEDRSETYLEEMLYKFNYNFPSTKNFSDYARDTLINIQYDNIDDMLVGWIEREEILFRTLEKYLIAERLSNGFHGNNFTDDFVKYSLTVQNRRKSRAGYSLENHIEELLKMNNIRYDRNKKTENNSKPDFIFPSIKEYHNPSFNASYLTMLGVKSTCKDRWRQILSEARKIKHKHLLTLEPAISQNQTEEMKFNSVQLVIPKNILNTYSIEQQKDIWTVEDFLNFVTNKQNKINYF